MTLLPRLARPLLASYFLSSGFRALRNPQQFVADAESVASTLVPLAKRVAPDSVAGRIPEETATLVRINGILQLGGGLALATGKGRRLGAALLAVSIIPSTLARHPFWSRDTPEAKANDRVHFLKNTSLLGGVLLASADTEGKPSIAWRAQTTGHAIAKDTRRQTQKLTRRGTGLGKTGRGALDAALASGTGLVGTVVKQTRKAQKTAQKQAKAAQKQAKSVQKQAKSLQKQAKKRVASVGSVRDLAAGLTSAKGS